MMFRRFGTYEAGCLEYMSRSSLRVVLFCGWILVIFGCRVLMFNL